jgi:F0F1-type ATP synthase assembly protein I
MPEPPDPAEKKAPSWSFARYSEMGFIIPAAVLLGFFLGKLADYWLHTKWLYLVGLLFGAVVGFWQMIRMADGRFQRKMNEHEHLDRSGETLLPAESKAIETPMSSQY